MNSRLNAPSIDALKWSMLYIANAKIGDRTAHVDWNDMGIQNARS